MNPGTHSDSFDQNVNSNPSTNSTIIVMKPNIEIGKKTIHMKSYCSKCYQCFENCPQSQICKNHLTKKCNIIPCSKHKDCIRKFSNKYSDNRHTYSIKKLDIINWDKSLDIQNTQKFLDNKRNRDDLELIESPKQNNKNNKFTFYFEKVDKKEQKGNNNFINVNNLNNINNLNNNVNGSLFANANQNNQNNLSNSSYKSINSNFFNQNYDKGNFQYIDDYFNCDLHDNSLNSKSNIFGLIDQIDQVNFRDNDSNDGNIVIKNDLNLLGDDKNKNKFQEDKINKEINEIKGISINLNGLKINEDYSISKFFNIIKKFTNIDTCVKRKLIKAFEDKGVCNVRVLKANLTKNENYLDLFENDIPQIKGIAPIIENILKNL